MSRYERIITKGDILRDNIYSVLVLVLAAACFSAWLYVNRLWTVEAIATTATTVSAETSSRGPLALIEWQVQGETYRRAAWGASTTPGAQTEVRYLPQDPRRALTLLEWQDEPFRLIGLPALIAFVLISLFKLALIYWGPRRADDRKVVARVIEHD